jgi:predicted RNA-binding Zn-ribbon protein involved in translation (DUF1610 family)
VNPFALVADMLADWLRRAFTLDARNRAAVRARREAARVAEAQAAHAERLARMRAMVEPATARACPDCGVTGGHAAWCRGTAAKPGEVRCPKCAGRGSFYLGADIVSNSLHSEDCRACGGTGYAAPADDLPGLARRESERR